MYNDQRPKAIHASVLSERCETESVKEARPIRNNSPVREMGDVEQQILRLNNNVNELEKIFSELHDRLHPILSENNCKDPCGDCPVEKSVSPLANDLRIQNGKLDSLKSRIMETIIRIQL